MRARWQWQSCLHFLCLSHFSSSKSLWMLSIVYLPVVSYNFDSCILDLYTFCAQFVHLLTVLDTTLLSTSEKSRWIVNRRDKLLKYFSTESLKFDHRSLSKLLNVIQRAPSICLSIFQMDQWKTRWPVAFVCVYLCLLSFHTLLRVMHQLTNVFSTSLKNKVRMHHSPLQI